MRFYVSWYPDDPYYQLYDDNCAMLVSVSSVARSWSLDKFPELPQAILIDSGGYRYASSDEQHPTPSALFERQMNILAGTKIKAILCALDFPIIGSDLDSNELDHCLTQTLAYAYEFKHQIRIQKLPNTVESMAVVQGHDIPTLVHCAKELKSIGFDRYGLGSLAPLKHQEEIVARVRAVIDVVGPNLHVFGVGSVPTLRELRRLGVRSVDTARPAKSSAYNQVFYSRPFRRFAIEASNDQVGRRMPDHRRLTKPLPCECPVCCGQANFDILKLGKREFIRKRAVHNYFHLKRSVLD